MAPKRKNKRKAAVEADQPETKRSSVKDEENHDDEVPAPSRRSKRARKAVNYKEPTESLAGLKAPALEDEASEEAFAEEEEGEEGSLTVREYRSRLVKHDKELYKDPPVLPILNVEILPPCEEPVTRHAKTRVFMFPDHPEFRPNLSPEEVLRRGSFGGTYFRPIHSAVVGRRIASSEALQCMPAEWIAGLDKKRFLTSLDYDTSVNTYGVKCGGSLGMWESSGWISDDSPYGWFMWYCKFFQGRRTSDDDRQISRALGVMGPKGRFRRMLMNKVISAKTVFDDATISPVQRQNLQHWAYELTEADLKSYMKEKGIRF